MSRNYYSEINLHLVWHTKNSLPLLTPAVEPLTHRLLKKRVVDTPKTSPRHQRPGLIPLRGDGP